MALLAPLPTIPIADLQPGIESADERPVSGVVTLIWPYASSERSLSLLLVEKDFRLRGKRGQVRVQFDGASAQAVAKSRVGSGDELLLRLKGVRWAKDESTATTPGRSIDWELHYCEQIQLQV